MGEPLKTAQRLFIIIIVATVMAGVGAFASWMLGNWLAESMTDASKWWIQGLLMLALTIIGTIGAITFYEGQTLLVPTGETRKGNYGENVPIEERQWK